MEYFKVQEFVDRGTYNKWGSKSLMFIDDRLPILADRLRELFGKPITINNWHYGGEREWSGLRTSQSPYYSPTSQHTFGRALDFLVSGIPAWKAREMIEKWYEEGLLGDDIQISMEYGDSITWVHIDIAWRKGARKGEVYKFYV